MSQSTASPDFRPAEAEDSDDRPKRMLSEGRLLELLPFSRATLYRMIKNKKFPGGTFISPHRRVWYEAEIAAWQREVDGRRRGWDTARERTNTTETDA